MSLVSEALRKARAGSPDPGAHRHGVVYRTTVVLGEGRRSGHGWRMAAAVVAAAAAGGAAAWWILGRAPARPLAPPRPEAAAVARPAGPASAAPTNAGAAAAERQASPVPAAAAPAAHTGVVPPAQPTPTTPRRAGLTAITAPAVPPAAATPSVERPARPPAVEAAAPAAPGGGARSFGLDADVGYAKLHLDYIVYRSKDPFAGINGQQVVIGSIVQGFTVEEIGPDRIRLRDPRGEVVLQIPH
ncbi:MAG: hypothetical protein PHQ91_08690 [Thermoanaerobaculaceae bacterium]|nr:hypothetical protein [Thermoanaerobaculaceae bacterium]